MSIPAGWYDDGSGRQRWWDGSQWTSHVSAPAASAEQTPSKPGPQDEVATGSEPQPFAPPYTLPTQTGLGTTPDVGSVSATGGQPPSDAGGGSSMPTYGAATHVLPPGAPSAVQQTSKKISVLGLIGLGAAVLGTVLACIPSLAAAGWILLGLGFVISLVSLFLPGRKWPGATGICLAIIGAILALIVALFSFIARPQTGADDSAPIATPTERPSLDDDPVTATESETVSVLDLEVGHCMPMVEMDEEVSELTIVPCDQPHDDEVYFEFELADGNYPGDSVIESEAIARCEAAFEDFIGISYAESELDYFWFSPTKYSWTRGDDRAVQCLVFSYDGEVTGSLAGEAR